MTFYLSISVFTWMLLYSNKRYSPKKWWHLPIVWIASFGWPVVLPLVINEMMNELDED